MYLCHFRFCISLKMGDCMAGRYAPEGHSASMEMTEESSISAKENMLEQKQQV